MADERPPLSSFERPPLSSFEVSDEPQQTTLQEPLQLSAGDIAKDVAASTAIGVPKGVIGMAGLPEQVAGWAASGLGYLTGRDPESFRDEPSKRLPSTGEIQRGVESVTGPFYEPKTIYGQYGQTVGEFVPAAMLGPGDVARRLVGQALVPGLASEFAGQATAGGAAEPWARAGTALVTGMRGVGKAERAAAEASRRQLLDVEMPAGTKALYNQVDAQTVGVPVPMLERSAMGQQMKYALDRAGIRDISRSDGELPHKLAQNAVSDTNDVYDLVQWRRNMRDDLFGKGSGRAAGILTEQVDQAIDRLAPGAAADLRAADREWALRRLGENLDQRFQTVEQQVAGTHSGTNLDNKIRQSLISFKKDERAWRSLPPHEQLMVDNIIKGGVPTNTLRYVSNLLGGGGGLGMAAAGVLGHAVLGHLGAVGLPLAGRALKAIENARVQTEANRLLADVLGRSQFAPTSVLDRLAPMPNWQRPGRQLYYGGLAGQMQTTPEGYPYYQQQ